MDKIVFKIPYPLLTLTLLFVLCLSLWTLLAPVARWYEAYVDQYTLQLNARTQVQVDKILSK